MTNLKSYNKIIQQFGSENAFEFDYDGQIYLIYGYPQWLAFLINPKIDLKFEVSPNINIETKKFEFLQTTNKQSSKSGIYFSVSESALLNSYLEKEKQFFSLIPEDVINHVKIFKDSHWEIVHAASIYGSYFIKLIDSNPVLAYLLVNLDKINPSFSMYTDKSYIEILITEKQKEILGLANLPPTKRAVKLISKFDIKTVDVELLKYFRHLFITRQKEEYVPIELRLPFLTKPDPQEDMVEELSHAPALNKNYLKTVCYYPRVAKILTSQALQELSVSDSFQATVEKLNNMAIDAYNFHVKLYINNLQELPRIERNFKALTKKYRDQINYLPPAPIPDGKGIYAMRTVAEINSWAKKQHNCIRDYVSKVKRKQCHLYKIRLKDEEATLEILIDGDNLSLGELKGFRNCNVSKELRQHISKWYHANKGSYMLLKRISYKGSLKQF